MEIILIPQKQVHWTWSEEHARECAREERELRSLAEHPVVLALASALGISPRDAAVMAQNRARARANTRAA
jgi:AraC-like DNA-binding protein